MSQMLEAVATMNQNRIYCRMRSPCAKWNCNFAKSKSQQPQLLPQFLQKWREQSSNRNMDAIFEDVDQLQRLSSTLDATSSENARSRLAVPLLVQMLEVVARLCADASFPDLPLGNFRSNLRKLANYVSVPRYILAQVRQKDVLSTATVQTVRFDPEDSNIGY
jgi:hypothetical protein